MKFEIEAAVNFLTTLLFPTNINTLSHSQSTPTLQSTSSRNNISNSSISTTSLNSHHNNEENLNATSEYQNEKISKLFSKTLSKILIKKFVGHWYEDEPIKGQAFRSILVDCENNFIDKVISLSARKIHWKNFNFVLKNRFKIGFQMWIDPGEVEVEFLSPSSSSSSTSPYKSSKISNKIIYTSRKNTSTSQQISRPISPPFSSSSFASSPSSSPPSSPAPSSYSSFSPLNDIKMPLFAQQNKPIRISVRQKGKLEEIVVKDINNNFNHTINEFNDDINTNNSTVKSTFAILQPAM